MVLEREIYPYLEWLTTGGGDSKIGALPIFLAVVAGLGLLAILLGFLVSLLRNEQRYGFIGNVLHAGDRVYQTLKGGISELSATSPSRVFALAKLAMKEAWRKKIVIALAIYLVLLLFAGWFLSVEHAKPARLYLSFVLTATTYLTLLIALLISAFSLPGDFKTKTIYTVVTKPVRAGEIILGRILGFTAIGTLLLAAMGLCNYLFVTRSLDHTHEAELESVERITNSAGEDQGRSGRTTNSAGHRHQFEVSPEGQGLAAIESGHTHEVAGTTDDSLTVGSAQGIMKARDPEYGELSFVDRTGVPKYRGISVGNEWAYRSFIDGNTLATAIWKFNDVNESVLLNQVDEQGEKVGEVLPLAIVVRVFKTHKGVIGRPISGTIHFRNPETGLASDKITFQAKDAQIDEVDIARAQLSEPDADGNSEEIDLIDDLVSKSGELEVLVKCAEGGQYFGFAQADLYIRKPEGSPLLNFIKVHLCIWVQMVIIISVGVAISPLVSGSVAMLFTAAFIILGFYREFFLSVANGTAFGGGPAEALVRMQKQANMVTKLDESLGTTIVLFIDQFIARPFMWGVGQLLPDLSYLDGSNYA
ncbi:MAG: hypothetical protein RID07_10015, partial [Lacipirellulaceae bacterium]